MITDQNRQGGVICAYVGFCLMAACQTFAGQVWPQGELLALVTEPKSILKPAANRHKPPVILDYFDDTADTQPELAQARETPRELQPAPEDPEPRKKANPVTTRPAVRVPVLRTGMLLDITVLVAGEKEIEEASKRIETDGTVSLPLVGRFPAADKTLGEFQESLQQRYNSQFFVNPQVVVDFSREGEEYASPWGYVTILGAVKTPGRISIPPTQDLVVSQAIQAAGGCTDVAKLTRIRIARSAEDGARTTFRVNLHDVGEMTQDDLVLEPGDVVFVPEAIF